MHILKIVTLVTLLALGSLLSVGRAEALPLQAAPAIGQLAGENDLRQDAAYYCRRVWTCGRYGCGWRRACGWTPGPYAYAYPYPSYGFGYRPYWRHYPSWGWRGGRRHWR